MLVTPPGRYDNDNSIDRAIVWPDANRFNILLSVFQTIKQLRNDANRTSPQLVNISAPYSMLDPNITDEDGNFIMFLIDGVPTIQCGTVLNRNYTGVPNTTIYDKGVYPDSCDDGKCGSIPPA